MLGNNKSSKCKYITIQITHSTISNYEAFNRRHVNHHGFNADMT